MHVNVIAAALSLFLPVQTPTPPPPSEPKVRSAAEQQAKTPEASVTVRVDPTVCFEPCGIKAKVRIEGLQEGRDVCIGLDNGSFYRSSCWPHNGLSVNEVSLRNIPTGDYQVIAAITGPDGKVRTARAPLHVIPEGGNLANN